MADEKMDLKGLEQTKANLSKYSKTLFDELVQACEAVQANVVKNAQARVPVVTTNLYKSIMPAGIVVTDDNVTAVVAANANYAGFVEGVDANWQPLKNWTRKITPYLGPALLENIETFRKAIVAAHKRAEGSL